MVQNGVIGTRIKMNFKDIHIGSLVCQKVTESGIEMSRICNFMKCSETEVLEMYNSVSMDSYYLLRWSKLLEYDFFRIYTYHLILYSPSASPAQDKKKSKYTKLPEFRKNIYTKELIDFILELIHTGEKTNTQVIEEYRIPKTTLYKWIKKYKTP